MVCCAGINVLDLESVNRVTFVTIQDYTIPNTDFIIKKDMMVKIPSNAIMKDPQFFDNPEEFNPLNFSADEKANRNPYSFLGLYKIICPKPIYFSNGM